MSDVSVRTIPNLFRAAVDDAPDSVWLRTDVDSLTYAQAMARVSGMPPAHSAGYNTTPR